MSPASSTSADVPIAAPLLVGPRARSGMQALADRLTAKGLSARVFGHPARAPANRDALVGAFGALIAGVSAWAVPEWGLCAGAGSLSLTAALGAGWVLWPRVSGWTVIVGHPSATTRRLHTLALDIRRPQRWRFAVAALPGVLVLLFPGQPVGVIGATLAMAVCAYDRVGARPVALDVAAEWAAARATDPETVVLVSTASSGYGEGVEAILRWFCLDPAKIELHLDEEGDSGVRDRLAKRGLVSPS